MRDPGRKPVADELAILRAIEAKDMKLMPENYHPADLAWLAFYGFIEISRRSDGVADQLAGGQWWPELARVTDKGRTALAESERKAS